jgi:hypothetical protein
MFGLVDGVDWFEKVVHMADDLVRVFYALGHGLVSVALAGVLGRDRGARNPKTLCFHSPTTPSPETRFERCNLHSYLLVRYSILL